MLQKITLIPIHEVTDKIQVKPNHVYVIPPNKLLTANDGILNLAIMKARSACYTQADVTTISPERLEKFFTKSDSGYQVNKVIRDLCVFATHNIIVNPPFAGIDLISCRNVLIYMDAFLQRKAMATFHYSLNEKGLLFLGRSESIGNSADLFGTHSERHKVYSKNGFREDLSMSARSAESMCFLPRQLLPTTIVCEMIFSEVQMNLFYRRRQRVSL